MANLLSGSGDPEDPGCPSYGCCIDECGCNSTGTEGNSAVAPATASFGGALGLVPNASVAGTSGVDSEDLSEDGASCCSGTSGACTHCLVNLTNGNLLASYSTPKTQRMVPFGIDLVYNSMEVSENDLCSVGFGWKIRQMCALAEDTATSTVVLLKQSGNKRIYTWNASLQKYVPPAGIFNTLVKTGNQFVETQRNQRKFYYDAYGTSSYRLSRIQDRNGHIWDYSYSNDRLQSITFKRSVSDTNGQVIRLGYIVDESSIARVSSITDPAGRITQLSYDGHKLASIKGPDGCMTTYDYDTSGLGLITGITTPEGHTTNYAYDGSNRLQKITDPDGGVINYGYTTGLTTVFDARGNKWEYGIEDKNLVSSKDPDGSQAIYVWQDNLLQTRTDAEGRVTSWTYNDNGMVTIESQPAVDGKELHTVYVYDTTHETFAAEVKAVDGGDVQNGVVVGGTEVRKTSYERSSTWNITKTSVDMGSDPDIVTQYAYMDSNNPGLVTQITDAETNITKLEYDSTLGYLKKQTVDFGTDKLNLVTRYSYDTKGNVASIKDADGNITNYEHDGRNRVVRQVNPDGTHTSRAYDGNGNLVSETDALGRKTEQTYDGNGRVTRITYVDGSSAAYGYDTAGNLVSETDAAGKITTHSYSNVNLRTQTKDPSGAKTSYEYDKVGNQKNITDSLGNVTSYSYDNRNRVEQVTAPLAETQSQVTEYGYDAIGNKTKETVVNPSGSNQVTDYTYDPANRMTKQAVDPYISNLVTDYSYYNTGQQKRVTVKDARGTGEDNVTQSNYDGAGRLASTVVDPDDLMLETKYSYDGVGNQTEVIPPSGLVTRQDYDSKGRVIRTVVDAGDSTHLNITTTYDYDAAGRKISETDPMGHVTLYEYDVKNRLIKTTVDAGDLNLVTTYEYDESGNQVSATDANGNTTRSEYDIAGRVVRSIDAMGYVTTYTYNEAGQKISETASTGVVTTYEYYAGGQLKTETVDPDGLNLQTSYEYDDLGRQTLVTDAEGNKTKYEYDSSGRLWKTTLDPDEVGYDGLNLVTEYTYWPTGQQKSITDPSGIKTEYIYDVAGRLSQVVVDSAGKNLKTNYVYASDGSSNENIVDPNGLTIVTHYDYDIVGRQIKVTEDYGTGKLNLVTEYEYDDSGNIVSVTDPEGHSIQQSYDGAKRLILLVKGDGTQENYTYDRVGNMLTKTKGDGSVITYSYDDNGRLVNKVYPDGSIHSYAYDAAGRKTVESGGESGPVTWDYDAVGRVVAVTQPVGAGTKTISYAYNKVGSRTSMTDAEGVQTTYSYDAAGRQTDVVNVDLETVHFVYDESGRMTDQYTNWDSQAETWGVHSEYSYDTAGRLYTLEHIQSGTPNTQILKQTYTTDNAGRRTQIVEAVGGSNIATTTFIYDNASRLEEEKRITDNPYWYVYTYDDAGNRLTKISKNTGGTIIGTITYTYDSGNKLLTESDGTTLTAYAYDANGNLTSKTVDSGTPVAYGWNYDDKMTSVDDTDDITMKTDADGFRRKKTVIEGGVTSFVYDLASSPTPGLAPIVAEYDGSGAVQARYHAGAAGLLAMMRSDTTYVYLCDGLGSVRRLTDITGTVTDSYLMDAWGNMMASSGSTANPFCYVGRQNYYTDTQNSAALMLLGVRYYSASAGRFITADPIGHKGGDYNIYRYVKDGPVNGVDPRGLWLWPNHRRCTQAWAWETTVFAKNYVYSSGINWKFQRSSQFNATEKIAQGSREADSALNSGAVPGRWHIHFNYHHSHADFNSSRDGLGLKVGYAGTGDARFEYYMDRRRYAISRLRTFGQPGCEDALIQLGMGLHALQDIYAHMDLSPAEHSDDRNCPSAHWPDNPHHGRSAAPKTIDQLTTTDKLIKNALYVFYRGVNPTVRLFGWPIENPNSPQSRAYQTWQISKRALEGFLTDIVTDPLINGACATCGKPSRLPTNCY